MACVYISDRIMLGEFCIAIFKKKTSESEDGKIVTRIRYYLAKGERD